VAPRPTALRAGLAKITGNRKVQLNILEIKKPELDAALDRSGCRRPARRPRRLPPGHEACRAERAEAPAPVGVRVQCSVIASAAPR